VTTRTVAGHPIRNSDDRCNKCERSVHDIMSYHGHAKTGDAGVACVGSLNAAEIEQMDAERTRRDAVWDAVVGVAR
jgi:hypothetical protein